MFGERGNFSMIDILILDRGTKKGDLRNIGGRAKVERGRDNKAEKRDRTTTGDSARGKIRLGEGQDSRETPRCHRRTHC